MTFSLISLKKLLILYKMLKTNQNIFNSFSLYRQVIPLVILEEGSYEKDVLFYVNIGEPQMVGGKFKIVVHLSFTILVIDNFFNKFFFYQNF